MDDTTKSEKLSKPQPKEVRCDELICPNCGIARQTNTSGGNPQLYHCGTTLKGWQSQHCEQQTEINDLEKRLRSAWCIIDTLDMASSDDGASWGTAQEWLKHNSDYKRS